MSYNIEQAGVYKITLYENKGVSVTYNQDGSVQTFSTTGDIIVLENSDCDTMELGLSFTSKRNANNKLKYKHTVTWTQLGLDNDNIELINTLKQSIYGWIVELEMYNGEIRRIITNPVKFIDASIKNDSNSYNIVLENVNFGNTISDLIALFNYVFEDGENYVFEDSENFIFE